MKTTEDLASASLSTPVATSLPPGPYEQAVARLRAAQHEFVSTPVISESLLMARNVAVVQALEAGVPDSVVRQILRMGDVAFELAVARGTYHRDVAQRCEGSAVGRA
ncbi:hypothetical protein [Georgenia daeguensis]|uniref:Uncharacterized protein n=1 Tax=Georgenia daeguensis TaxID=908355 RepID=A0ABP8EW74_9MICO